jgi:hypothetical protein
VVRFGKVDELEVKAEGPGELIGRGQIERADASQRLLKMHSGGLLTRSALRAFGFAAGDRGTAQRFDGIVEQIAGLLAENFAEKHPKRTNIAA